jgi:hypothetical protein
MHQRDPRTMIETAPRIDFGGPARLSQALDRAMG